MSKRIAIVHDNLLEFGGSERVVLEMIRVYPTADLFTFFFNHRNPQIQQQFGKQVWKTSFVQRLPLLSKLGRYFSLLKPLAWWHFAHLDLSDYELVISSSHSYNSKLVKTGTHTTQLCYLHTPPKFLYGYAHELKHLTKHGLWARVLTTLRAHDLRAARLPDHFLVNSREVQRRVKQLYHRESTVLHPPVKLLTPNLSSQSGKYFVAHSRLVKQKNIQLIIEACTRYNLPLKIIGEGYLRPQLEQLAGETVEFLGFVPDEKLARVYRSAKALLYAAEDEDFGIVPVEAQSAGVPVLAYRSGGVLESVIEGETGYFFDELTVASVMKAVRKLERLPLMRKKCVANAQQFSDKRFRSELKKVVTKLNKSNE